MILFSGPYRGWDSSAKQDRLRLQRTNGMVVERNASTNASVILRGHAYKIAAPLLEPKEQMFAGYEQPYSKIHYELDFSLGAEVDIGCGTAVNGDASGDDNVRKDVFAHPLSMMEASYQWYRGRANPNADPPDPGYYPQNCPRYHRFEVTKPGNFTFVRAAALALPCSLPPSRPCVRPCGVCTRPTLAVGSFFSLTHC